MKNILIKYQKYKEFKKFNEELHCINIPDLHKLKKLIVHNWSDTTGKLNVTCDDDEIKRILPLKSLVIDNCYYPYVRSTYVKFDVHEYNQFIKNSYKYEHINNLMNKYFSLEKSERSDCYYDNKDSMLLFLDILKSSDANIITSLKFNKLVEYLMKQLNVESKIDKEDLMSRLDFEMEFIAMQNIK